MPAHIYTDADDRQLFKSLTTLSAAQLLVIIAFLLLRSNADRDRLQHYITLLA